MRRVVVTGIGIVSPLGTGIEEFWRSLDSGKSGIAPITLFDASTLPVRIGGEVKGFEPVPLRQRFPALAGEWDRKVLLGFHAAAEAMIDAGTAAEEGLQLPGVVEIGVSLEVILLEEVVKAWHAGGQRKFLSGEVVRAAEVAVQTPLDRLAGLVAEQYRFRGPLYTNCSACVASCQTIGHAFHLIRNGACDVALAGGADSMLNPLGVGGFSLLQALSTENDTPTFACRPFHATRLGTVLGEAAAFLFLEEAERALRRRAKVFAEVLGYASSLDAYRISDPLPDGSGAVRAMRNAIGDAGLQRAAIDHINAHGTGTPKNDVAETLAIKQVFGDRAYRIPITAVKSMTGHTIGASGALEAVASILTLVNGRVPPTINLDHPDPACDLDYVPESSRPFSGRTVLSNSFGFGGQNATLILGKWEE